jgi:hypothetical protein
MRQRGSIRSQAIDCEVTDAGVAAATKQVESDAVTSPFMILHNFVLWVVLKTPGKIASPGPKQAITVQTHLCASFLAFFHAWFATRHESEKPVTVHVPEKVLASFAVVSF